jgi:hypothetical protein
VIRQCKTINTHSSTLKCLALLLLVVYESSWMPIQCVCMAYLLPIHYLYTTYPLAYCRNHRGLLRRLVQTWVLLLLTVQSVLIPILVLIISISILIIVTSSSIISIIEPGLCLY